MAASPDHLKTEVDYFVHANIKDVLERKQKKSGDQIDADSIATRLREHYIKELASHDTIPSKRVSNNRKARHAELVTWSNQVIAGRDSADSSPIESLFDADTLSILREAGISVDAVALPAELFADMSSGMEVDEDMQKLDQANKSFDDSAATSDTKEEMQEKPKLKRGAKKAASGEPVRRVKRKAPEPKHDEDDDAEMAEPSKKRKIVVRGPNDPPAYLLSASRYRSRHVLNKVKKDTEPAKRSEVVSATIKELTDEERDEIEELRLAELSKWRKEHPAEEEDDSDEIYDRESTAVPAPVEEEDKSAKSKVGKVSKKADNIVSDDKEENAGEPKTRKVKPPQLYILYLDFMASSELKQRVDKDGNSVVQQMIQDLIRRVADTPFCNPNATGNRKLSWHLQSEPQPFFWTTTIHEANHVKSLITEGMRISIIRVIDEWKSNYTEFNVKWATSKSLFSTADAKINSDSDCIHGAISTINMEYIPVEPSSL